MDDSSVLAVLPLIRLDSPTSMKNEIATNPAYRKVVAALNDCEERYDGLIKSMVLPIIHGSLPRLQACGTK